MNDLEKCPDCGERDCGGAPRFKGLSSDERAALREKEAQERAAARRQAMYTSYRNEDEDFGRCGNCHKPLITCLCDPDDVDDEGET